MVIVCQACDRPVHDNVVRCPHCGGATGVAADPIAAGEVRAIDGLGALIGAVLTAGDAEPIAEPQVELPRAVARTRRPGDPAAPPPIAAEEPEPAAPTPLDEEPRFLK